MIGSNLRLKESRQDSGLRAVQKPLEGQAPRIDAACRGIIRRKRGTGALCAAAPIAYLAGRRHLIGLKHGMAFDFYEWSARSTLRWTLWRIGRLVGTDALGNRYYEQRKAPRRGQTRKRRFVVYNGAADASRVPPEWHGWLHHQTDRVPGADSPFTQPWVQEHQPNLTGTLAAYRPPGSTLRGGERPPATGDYQPWTPPA